MRFLIFFGPLLVAKLMSRLFPLKKLQWIIGRPVESAAALSQSARKQQLAEKTGIRIYRTAQKLPWRSVCLDQALALALVLRILKVKFRFHLGINKTKELKAHAWITSGGRIIIGWHPGDEYTEVGVFEA